MTSIRHKFKAAAFSAVFLLLSSVSTAHDLKTKSLSANSSETAHSHRSEAESYSVEPLVWPKGMAPALYGPGDLYSMLVTADQSNGTLFQFEAIVPPGGGPPSHVHSREDESFYMVSGTLEFQLDQETYVAEKGDYIYAPKGVVHQFKNVGNDDAVLLITMTPAGLDGFFEEAFPEVTDRNEAPPPITKEFIQRMNNAASKYGLEYVDP